MKKLSFFCPKVPAGKDAERLRRLDEQLFGTVEEADDAEREAHIKSQNHRIQSWAGFLTNYLTQI